MCGETICQCLFKDQINVLQNNENEGQILVSYEFGSKAELECCAEFLMQNKIRPTTVCKPVHHQGFFITPRVALEGLLYLMTFHITIQGDASKMVYNIISDEMMQGNWGFTKPFSLWLRNIVSQMNTEHRCFSRTHGAESK